jgi:phosphoenolpyruvate synthase/pyruvate phosphate dikinase
MGDRRRPLTEEHLAALAALAARIDHAFPGGSDVEWAVTGDQLWVLQRRPITG